MSEYHRMTDLSPLVKAKVEEAKAIVGDLLETAIADHLIALGWKRPEGDASGGDVEMFLSYPPRIRSEMLDLGKAIVDLEATHRL